MSKPDKYLRIDFGDNDFGWRVENAAKRLWSFVKENNTNPGQISEADIFKQLQKQEKLAPFMDRLITLEHSAFEVEWATRGLHVSEIQRIHTPGPEWKEIEDLPKLPRKDQEYLVLSFEFRPSDAFTTKWENGECVSLNLRTGATELF